MLACGLPPAEPEHREDIVEEAGANLGRRQPACARQKNQRMAQSSAAVGRLRFGAPHGGGRGGVCCSALGLLLAFTPVPLPMPTILAGWVGRQWRDAKARADAWRRLLC